MPAIAATSALADLTALVANRNKHALFVRTDATAVITAHVEKLAPVARSRQNFVQIKQLALE
jgi:hypothetical protein